jgi:mono/diheme cytochrome c family protein
VRAVRITILRTALSCLALAVAGMCAGSLLEQAPPKASVWVNPYQGDQQARQAGAKLYFRECAGCHGRNAAGSGKAPALAAPGVYNAAPGTLFWILRNGWLRRGMPSFAHLPEPQRWQIVTYLGSLQPAAGSTPDRK